MANDDDDLQGEYERERREFEGLTPQERSSGTWLTKLLHRVLSTYAAQVDADYVRRRYPGAGRDVHAKKAIKLASRNAAIVGGSSATVITALETSIIFTGGLDAIIAVPAIGSAVLADAALTTRTQLRAIVDLAAIRGAPLSLDDHEDCVFIFMNALGVAALEKGTGIVRSVGPKVVAYNVRKLLRSGLRAAIVAALKKVIGTALARRLTEKVLMRALVPGLSIPISAGMRYAFTRSILRNADRHLRRRAAVIPALVRFFHSAPDASRLLPIRTIVSTVESVQRDEWEEAQLHALRQAQSFLHLSDDELKELDTWFDRTPTEVANTMDDLPAEAGRAATDVLVALAALGRTDSTDAYVDAVNPLAERFGYPIDAAAIETMRARLA